MKILFGALALALATTAAAQTAPAADPKTAAPGQHDQHGDKAHAQHGQMDHARMMEKCKDPKLSAEMKAHCAAMMKEHGAGAPAGEQPKDPHAGHAH